MADDVTTGEIYRRLVDMDDRVTARFDRIDARFDRIDNRVITTEKAIARLEERTDRPGLTGAATGGGVSLLALLGWEWLKAKLRGQ